MSKERQKSISWPARQALPRFAKPCKLEVADVLNEPGDMKLLLATLQGIVNRAEPRIYLLENAEEGKFVWLDELDIPYVVRDNCWDIVEMFKDEITGIVVYDLNVPDSINVATTLAGLRDAIVASPDLALQLTRAPFCLQVVEDLQGKFKDRLDAYTWQYEHLWKETTRRMLIGLSPDRTVPVPSGIPSSFQTIAEETNRVRAGRNRSVYDLDLSAYLGKPSVYLRFDDAFPQDGWGAAVHQITVKADGQVIAQFVAGSHQEEAFLYDRHQSQRSSANGGHRFADNGKYFVYEFSPPIGTKQLIASVDMWNQFKVSAGNERPPSSARTEPYGYLRDYAVANNAMVFWLDSNDPEQKRLFQNILSDVEPGTPYLGWFSNDVEGEFSSVEIASNYGVYVLAADWFNNLTVFSGTEAKTFEPPAARPTLLENKIYVTFIVSEGDNFQYNQHRMRRLWDDPNRGKVPINWTSSPLLHDGAPAILNYFRATATGNDLLIAGPSGAGYFYPNAWKEHDFTDFLKRFYSYMNMTGMSIPYVLNRIDGDNVPLGEAHAVAYLEEYGVSGLFLSWEDRYGVELSSAGFPISIVQGIGTVQDGISVCAQAKADWDGKSPVFVSLGLLAWSLTPTDVVEITDSLGPEFQVVRADDYFSLLRQFFGLPGKP